MGSDRRVTHSCPICHADFTVGQSSKRKVCFNCRGAHTTPDQRASAKRMGQKRSQERISESALLMDDGRRQELCATLFGKKYDDWLAGYNAKVSSFAMSSVRGFERGERGYGGA